MATKSGAVAIYSIGVCAKCPPDPIEDPSAVKLHSFWRTSLDTVENGAQLFARTAVHPYAEVLCIWCVIDARYENANQKLYQALQDAHSCIFGSTSNAASKSQILDISLAHSLACLYDRLSTLQS